MVAELSLDHDNYGLFVRGSLLYDDLVEDSTRRPARRSPTRARTWRAPTSGCSTPSSTGAGTSAGTSSTSRAGNQVVNWGESTFIQGGINAAINHFDVAALRVPGSELREAYLPQEMVKVSFGLTDNLTAEAIALFDWDPTQPEPVGTYFSSNDFVPQGGDRVFLGFGAYLGPGHRLHARSAVPSSRTSRPCRARRSTVPSDSGQYGASLRWFMPDFAQGTELGFYFVNYHSKLPRDQRPHRDAGRHRQLARHADGGRSQRHRASPRACRSVPRSPLRPTQA